VVPGGARRRWLWPAIAALVLAGASAVAVRWSVQTGHSTSEFAAAPFPEGLTVVADLDRPFLHAGSHPIVTAAGSTVVAWTSADYSFDSERPSLPPTRTVIALSTDGGRTLRTVPFHRSLTDIQIAVGEARAIVIGRLCPRPPARSQSACASGRRRSEAYGISLRDLAVERLSDPPHTYGPGSGAGFIGDNALFAGYVSSKPTLLVFDADAWTRRPLPAAPYALCMSGGRLTLVNPASEGLGSEASEGQPVWSWAVSTDEGRRWTSPRPYRSAAAYDFTGDVKVSCGPGLVIASTGQTAVFDPGRQQWRDVTGRALRRTRPDGATWQAADAVTVFVDRYGHPLQSVTLGRLRSPSPDVAVRDDPLPEPFRYAYAVQASRASREFPFFVVADIGGHMRLAVLR